MLEYLEFQQHTLCVFLDFNKMSKLSYGNVFNILIKKYFMSLIIFGYVMYTECQFICRTKAN